MIRIIAPIARLACVVLFGCSLVFAKSTLTSDDVATLVRQGKELEAQKKYAEAAAIYTRLVEALPDDGTPYVLLGWVQHLQGKRTDALANLEMAVLFAPEDNAARNRRGLVRQAAEDFKGAAEDFATVAQRVPTDSRSRYNLAFCLLRTGRLKEALAPLDEAVTLDPANAEYYNLRGAIYDKLGDKSRALADCEQALLLTKDEQLIAVLQQAKQRLTAPGDQEVRSADSLLPTGRPTREVASTRAASPGAQRVAAEAPEHVSSSVGNDIAPDAVKLAAIDSTAGLIPPPHAGKPVANVAAPAPASVSATAQEPSAAGAAASPRTADRGPAAPAAPRVAPSPPAGLASDSASSVEPPPTAPAASPVGGVMPITLPPPMDLSRVTAEHWAGIVAQAKEGLALVYGELTPEQQKRFDAQWAPFFAFPSIEVKTYFGNLEPLVSEFVLLKEAYGRTAVACDQAQFELVSALAGDDAEVAVSLSYQLKQTKGLLAAQAARMKQLSQAVTDLGPWPDVADLKKKAGKRHHDIVTQYSAAPQSIEGTWKGKEISSWTIQILAELRGGLLLVDAGSRGVLQPLDQPNSWLFVAGRPTDPLENCRFWRLDLIDGALRQRTYTPPPSGSSHDGGKFKTYRSEKTQPLAQRKPYRPENDVDDNGKPVDWVKLFEERVQARRGLVEILRTGELPHEQELSRRREWAATEADGELNDVINRMTIEQSKPEEAIDRSEAQGRALLRMINEQHYYFGNRPPGFDNCAKYDPLVLQFQSYTDAPDAPDLEARRRRQNILLWNIHLRLQTLVKIEQDRVLSLNDLKPAQVSHDLDVLNQGIARNAQSIAKIKDEGEKAIAYRQELEHDEIADDQRKEKTALDNLDQKQQAELASLNRQLASYRDDLAGKSAKDQESARQIIPRLQAEIAQLPQKYKIMEDAVRKDTNDRVAERRGKTKEQIAYEQQVTQTKVDGVQSDTAENQKRFGLISAKTIRRVNDQGGYDEVPLALVLAEAKKKVEDEFDLPGYAQGLVDYLDSEMPTTAGRMGLENFGDATVIPGDCQIELPSSLAMQVSRASSSQPKVATTPAPSTAPSAADETAKQAAALAAEEKKEKLALFQEEITQLQKALDGVSKTEAEISESDPDGKKKLEGLARDRLSLDASIKAAQDQVNFVETGVYQRTRTAADDFNRQIMLEDSQATATYWDNINRKLNRMDRLIEQARPEDRDRLRAQWNDEVSSAIAAGAKFERLDSAAKNIGEQVIAARQKEGQAADAEAASADRNLAIAETVKTAASYSLTALTMYATAGLASPASLIMPTCAESAVSATYSMTTGYIEGGPTEAFKQAAGAYSQTAGLFNTAMDSYQKGVLDHLEEHARDPQRVQLDETRAGLSAMGWALSQEGVKMAAMHFVVTPALAGVKDALKTPPSAPNSGGIFGPEEIRFKTVAEMKEDRLFKDKDLFGKQLMEQFKKAHTDLENARGVGKSGAELAPFMAQAEAAYNAANSDFHAKNWMKRMAKLDEGLTNTWCEIDAAQKGRVIEETKAILRAKGLSEAELRCYSNSASKGSVGMDMDLGFVEPSRWKQVPDPRVPKETPNPRVPKPEVMMTVLNPEYWEWRNKLTRLDPVTGRSVPISPREYAQHAHEAMNEAYKKVYGHGTDEAFLEFTYRDHPEAYKDMAMLGKKDGPPWADFANVNPALNGQSADVTGFKVNRLQKPSTATGHDELPSLPRYSAMLEQCRGLVKDFDTKMIGAKADTAAFGNESGNQIKINPTSPLGQAPATVQKHFLELRTVLNDFASGRLTPSQAERQLQVLTGGQGVVEVPKQMQAVLANFKPGK
jgi:tetratricopeptide (TPR) repeat protein